MFYHFSIKAFESCDPSYKPVFAEPKPSRSYHQDVGMGPGGPGSTTSGSTIGSNYNMMSDGQCRLAVTATNGNSQGHIWRLFDLVPGLDNCEQKPGGGGGGYRQSSRGGGGGDAQYLVQYNNAQSASYAKEKLHGFEYPPGCRIVVKYESGHSSSDSRPYRGGQLPAMPSQQVVGRSNVDIAHLTETIANATALLKAAGYSSPGMFFYLINFQILLDLLVASQIIKVSSLLSVL